MPSERQPRPSVSRANKATTMTAACPISRQARQFMGMALVIAPTRKKQTATQKSAADCHQKFSDM